MLKQINLFAKEDKSERKYTSTIKVPVYDPANEKPHILSLCDKSKTLRLIARIEGADLPPEEKAFLIEAAHRHTVFHYQKIADYYAHSGAEMQELMEDSALVIVDFGKAIESGFVKLCKEIREEYLQEYGD